MEHHGIKPANIYTLRHWPVVSWIQQKLRVTGPKNVGRQ